MAALAAMQDPNSFAQFLQQQQMGNMSMSRQQAQQAQQYNAYVAATDLKSEPTKASLEAVADAAAKTPTAGRRQLKRPKRRWKRRRQLLMRQNGKSGCRDANGERSASSKRD